MKQVVLCGLHMRHAACTWPTASLQVAVMFAIFNGFILTFIIYGSSGAQAYKDRMDSTLVSGEARRRVPSLGEKHRAHVGLYPLGAPGLLYACMHGRSAALLLPVMRCCRHRFYCLRRLRRRCLQQMLKQRRVPPALRKSILDYLAAKYAGRRVNQDEEVLRELPPAIRSQVSHGRCAAARRRLGAVGAEVS